MRKLDYIISEEDADLTVNAYARGRLGMSMHFVRSVKFRENGITVNGSSVTTRYRLKAGDHLAFTMPDEENARVLAVSGPLDMVYENEDVVLLDKAAGVVVHPCHGHYADTLVNYLLWHYEQLGKQVLLRPVGRLDKDTSGLIFIAKNRYASRFMENMRSTGSIQRYYLAMVEGSPGREGLQGVIQAPLAKTEGVFNRYEVREDGKPSTTYFKVVKNYHREDGDLSLILLKLETGRTHQIRVHMAFTGHPLAGDPIYGKAGSHGAGRAMLHSFRIDAVLPGETQPRTFISPPPEDFLCLAGEKISCEGLLVSITPEIWYDGNAENNQNRWERKE